MATSSLEMPEVMVGDKPVSMEELDNVRNAVCLLKCTSRHTSNQWSGYGFYANVKTIKKDKTLDRNCILTAYDDIFLEMDKHGGDMVAVFHHESDEKEAFELPLNLSFNLPLAGGERRPKYALIFIDESKMEGKGVKPILADGSQLPDVQPNDKVYMIHHPEKMKEYYSEDKARRVTEESIEYNANTLKGPPGSPVFVLRESKFVLVAIQCASSIEGVLVSHILNDHYTLGGVSGLLPFKRPRELCPSPSRDDEEDRRKFKRISEQELSENSELCGFLFPHEDSALDEIYGDSELIGFSFPDKEMNLRMPAASNDEVIEPVEMKFRMLAGTFFSAI